MKKYRNWIIGFVISATVGAVALQNGLTSSPINPPAGNEPCAYMEAYQDVPDLAAKIETSIHTLNSDAKIRAQAYGENCVASDGSGIFSAKETDVYVRTTVEDLPDEEAFGNWMAQVLPLIVQIPESEFPGSYGFVEFWFEKNDAEHVIVRVPIQEYLNTGQGKIGKELFEIFSNP